MSEPELTRGEQYALSMRGTLRRIDQVRDRVERGVTSPEAGFREVAELLGAHEQEWEAGSWRR